VPAINVANFVAETTAEFQRGLTLDLTPWGSHKVRIYGKAKSKKVRGDLIKPKNSLMVSPVQFDGRTFEEHRNVIEHMSAEYGEGRDPLSGRELTEEDYEGVIPNPDFQPPPWKEERREAQDRGSLAELMEAILQLTQED
jgi:hypothetical protein